MISTARSEAILAAFSRQSVVVVGDLMLDRYVSGAVSRISPEAPVPVVQVTEERYRPGGAANVAVNIRSLGGAVDVVGFVGEDPDGAELTETLAAQGVGTDWVVALPSCRTTVKTRVVAERQQVVRVDREADPSLLQASQDAICGAIRGALETADGVIVEDYGKGTVSQACVDAVQLTADARGIPIALDPKDDHELAFSGIRLATPNYREACLAAGLPEKPLCGSPLDNDSLIRAGELLLRKWVCDQLMITLGAAGMCLVQEGVDPVVIPTRAQEVFDVSGAGDTVIATTLLALLAGAEFGEAAELANIAAGVVVGKLGTAVCTPDELLAAVAE